MTDFTLSEYQSRIRNAQSAMDAEGIDALLLTQEVDFAYFVGFQTRFWQSPTRPWFLIIPQGSAPIAVIPSIGEYLMQQAGVAHIRTWSAPNLQDDGIALLCKTIQELKLKRIGLPSEMESHLRMPLNDWQNLQSRLPNVQFGTDHNIARNLRMIKSQAEIEAITLSCQIGARAFFRVPEIAQIGEEFSQIARKFQMLCLEEGADFVPYLAGALEDNGYHDVISPAHNQHAKTGDILMLDTGLIHGGYFCDYNRNYSFGAPNAMLQEAHSRLIEATDIAIDLMRVETPIAQIFDAMQKPLSQNGFSAGSGRFGHGLGLYLTEWPSIIPEEKTLIQENMVMTIEPSIHMPNGKILVHEENVAITKDKARRLSPRYEKMVIL